MKKALFLTSCLVLALLTSFPSFASDPDDLKFDEQKINTELGKLNKLEQHVITHEGVTLEEVSASNSQLTEGVTLEVNSIAAVLADGELPGNIPPFWWGFCLGWVGLLLVYILTDNDKPQVKKAFTGCLISAGIALAVYLIFVVAIGASWGWGGV